MSIHPTAIVDEQANLAEDVTVGPYAVVGPGVTLASGVNIGAHAVVHGPTTIGKDCVIFSHAVIGGAAQDLKFKGEEAFLKVGERNTFREFATVNRGTMGGTTTIGDDNLFMA